VGSMDALTSQEVQGVFEGYLAKGETRLVADLSQVDFMSSAGLRALLTIVTQARQQGGDLYLAAARPFIEKTLKISGFTSLLKTFPTVELASASF